MVKTLRCGRRIPASNPGRGIILKDKTQFLKGTMLCLFRLFSYIIPILLLLDLKMGANGAMVVMGVVTAGATLPVLFFLFLRGVNTPIVLFFFFNLLPCRTRLQYLS